MSWVRSVILSCVVTDILKKAGAVSRSLFLVLAVLFGAPAQAQLAPQWNYCTGNPNIDWNSQIKNCTTLIQSSRETSNFRSIAYINRGLAYYILNDFDHAISDYSEAITLDPQSIIAYHNRGMSFKSSGALD